MIKNTLLEKLSAPIVVAAHMRSGTHLTIDLLRRQFKSVGSWKWPGEANDSTYLALDVMGDLEANWGEKRAIRILKRCDRPIFKLHWTDPSPNSTKSSLNWRVGSTLMGALSMSRGIH